MEDLARAARKTAASEELNPRRRFFLRRREAVKGEFFLPPSRPRSPSKPVDTARLVTDVKQETNLA